MIIRKNRPCRNCVPPKRYPGCQDHCNEFKAFKEEDDEIRKELYNEKLSASYSRMEHNARYRRHGRSD